jgi:hypothetical protein
VQEERGRRRTGKIHPVAVSEEGGAHDQHSLQPSDIDGLLIAQVVQVEVVVSVVRPCVYALDTIPGEESITHWLRTSERRQGTRS